MIEDTENIVSFAPHIPVGEAANLAAYLPQLPPEAYTMTELIDAIYVFTTPLYGCMFTLLVILARRSLKQSKEASDRALAQNDEAWKLAHEKFDKLVESMNKLSQQAVASEVRLQMHIEDQSAHNYGRRDKDV